MIAKRIFYITTNELTTFYCHKGEVSKLARYAATAEGVTQFSQYLELHPEDPSAILVDVIEEEYRMETIPHVTGRDRNHLIDRKLNKIFRRSPFCSAEVQGREKVKRRDDQVLCAALTNPEPLELWLAEVRNNKIPLSGIYSVATVTEKLLINLKIENKYSLVLSTQRENLLRQSFFHLHKLKISRLSLLSKSDVKSYISDVKNEVERMQRYINRLKLLPFNEPMDIVLLSSSEHLNLYQNEFRDSHLLRYHVIDLNEAANQIGLKTPLHEGQNEWLYAYLASMTSPVINYAPVKERQYYKMFQMRKGLVAASLILALCGAIFSSVSVLDAWKIKAQTEETAARVVDMSLRHAKAVEDLPDTQFPPKVMRAAVEADKQLSARKSHPQTMIALLGKELSRLPNIHLDEIRWEDMYKDEAVLDDDLVMDDEGNVIESIIESESYLSQMVIIKARLSPHVKSYQTAFDQIDNFINQLKRNKSLVKVEAISLPLNVDREDTLMGESGLDLKNPTAYFEIKVVMKVHHDAA